MNFGIKDIVMVGAIVLTLALAVNHYGELDIAFLNDIEKSLIPSDSGSSRRSSPSVRRNYSGASSVNPECARMKKLSGDGRTGIRRRIQEAEKSGDRGTVMEMREKLADMDQRLAEVCR